MSEMAKSFQRIDRRRPRLFLVKKKRRGVNFPTGLFQNSIHVVKEKKSELAKFGVLAAARDTWRLGGGF
jgi:hypothetical protein